MRWDFNARRQLEISSVHRRICTRQSDERDSARLSRTITIYVCGHAARAATSMRTYGYAATVSSRKKHGEAAQTPRPRPRRRLVLALCSMYLYLYLLYSCNCNCCLYRSHLIPLLNLLSARKEQEVLPNENKP
jgi:hypothetical protein